MENIGQSDRLPGGEVEIHVSDADNLRAMLVSHLNCLSIVDFRIGFEGSPIIGDVNGSTSVVPPPLNLAFDRHEFAQRSDYVSIGHSGVDLFHIRLAVSTISSIVTGFATHIAAPFGPLGSGLVTGLGFAGMLEFLRVLFGTRNSFLVIPLPLAFSAHRIGLGSTGIRCLLSHLRFLLDSKMFLDLLQREVLGVVKKFLPIAFPRIGQLRNNCTNLERLRNIYLHSPQFVDYNLQFMNLSKYRLVIKHLEIKVTRDKELFGTFFFGLELVLESLPYLDRRWIVGVEIVESV